MDKSYKEIPYLTFDNNIKGISNYSANEVLLLAILFLSRIWEL